MSQLDRDALPGRFASQQYPARIPFAIVMAYPGRLARFLSNIDTETTPDRCHLWKGKTTKKGYGLFQVSSHNSPVNFRAHRLAFWVRHGREPDGIIMHSCDTPACCNPDHLRDGTHAENVQDAVSKGRHNGGRTRVLREKVPKKSRGARPPHPRERDAIRMREEGCRPTDIAKEIGVTPETIHNWLKKEGFPPILAERHPRREDAIKMWQEGRGTQAAIAKEIGVDTNTVYKWCRKARNSK